ncbi:type VI secretion system baseplate subunit TssF [Pseudomonas sp. JZ134]|uniref:type VI secretion system baseplate subunit TssF n=1 Tax=Pseudomonas sp. JZ134 TaxID=2806615 RepID=UPI003DA006A7
MSDSLDAILLDYYQRELTWLRRAGSDFAQRHPKVAQRLELSPSECADPHVERLLESFALLTARLSRRLDDEYAEFSNALLEQLYPLSLRPWPSCAIAQVQPNSAQGSLAQGHTLPRGVPLFATTSKGDSIHFRTAAPVTIWPLEISGAGLLGSEETQALTGLTEGASALRLDVVRLGETPLNDLPLSSLRIYLSASPMVNAQLYDLLGAHTLAVLSSSPGEPPERCAGLPRSVGFLPEESLLPDEDGIHPGLRLLAEFFAFPDKFTFFDIPVSAPAGAIDQMTLYLVFDEAPAGRISLQREDIALGCVPVINLFPRTSEPLRPDGTRSEYRLVADAYRENSVEIHSIRSVRAHTSRGVRAVAPYYSCQHNGGSEGLYWHARRIEGLNPLRQGSDLMISLVDTQLDPAREAPEYSYTADLLCTSRHMAQTLAAGTPLNTERPGPVACIKLLTKPLSQIKPDLTGASRWQLVSQLTLNHLSLVEGEHALAALKEMLHLHNLRGDGAARRQIEGITRLETTRIVDRVGHDAWRGWRNGYEVRVELDSAAMTGTSPVLFTGVLAHFFCLYANANRFVRTVLIRGDKGIQTWQPRMEAALSL